MNEIVRLPYVYINTPDKIGKLFLENHLKKGYKFIIV